MLKLTVFAAVVTLCVCAAPHEKIAKVFKEMDYNKNDNINRNEILAFFLLLQDTPGVALSERDFIKNWSKRYEDSAVVSGKLFEKMDFNNDALLTESDADHFLAETGKNITNGIVKVNAVVSLFTDNEIEWAEFEATFNAWYAEIL